MDPIKVDFSSDNNRSDSKFVIPPEKKGLRIIISLVIAAIGAVVGYYFYLPAFNFKSIEMYIYIAAVIGFYCVVNYILSGAMRTPDFAPYAKKSIRIPVAIIGIIAIVVAGGYVVSSVFFRARSYSQIIDVDADGAFADEVVSSTEDNFDTVPRIDDDTTGVLAARALSDLSKSGYVSQFTVEPTYNQINYKNKPVRLATFQYSNIFKWLTSSDERIPAFIKIDTITQKAELVMVKGGLQYSNADHLSHYVRRQIRFEYPTYILDTPQFEIDDNEHPYWITAVLDKTIGLFGGTDVKGVVVCDAVTGECKEYTMEQIKTDKSLEWIDRVYSANLLVEQYNYYGRYGKGFWNSVVGQKNTYCTSDGYSYLAMNDDVYLYTGVTSLTNDQSLTGFTLINMRTKEAKYYVISGAKEESAQESANGLVQDLKYNASFPLLLNIEGVPTYFMPLKDSGNLVKMYAMINVEQSSVGGHGSSLSDCIDNYVAALKKNNISSVKVSTENITEATDVADEETPAVKTVDVTGKIKEIRTAVISGDSVYYIKLDTSETFYSVKAADFEKVVTYNVNDTVTITVEEAEGEIIPVDDIK